ncbi:histone acetyltransferase MCC1 [Cocos nucifera]|uniref:N-alpha-acetyltransferase 60 n=1 Tax=Cocos nucifera TaxID=13894 RepID=A0A8K0IES9_COCNU|nr:histone acetyltransferase MCC1 [Cocos nucifera]
MLEPRAAHHPTIIYRPIRPSDLEILEQIHAALFPIRYEREFFLDVVNGHGIISWAAVDISRLDGQNDELIGFVTARIIPVTESEIEDLLRYDASRKDQILVYILTLGVVEHYRNLGIATSLVREVIKYASSMPNCRAVYLHVIAYNQPAISFYKKMLFKLVRRLPSFYYIQGQHYDSYLFVFYVHGGRYTCSPQEIMSAVAAYFRGLFRMLSAKLRRNEEKSLPRWSRYKETSTLLVTQNKRILGAENATCQSG